MSLISDVRILVVAAHADDEVLGCGGTLARSVKQGSQVKVVFMTNGVGARNGGNEDAKIAERKNAAVKACGILGINDIEFFDFPDNAIDQITRLQIVQVIEKIITSFKPSVVFTHHGGDVNIDHRRVHDAVITACRPQPKQTVSTLLFFEVASSTEYQASNVIPQFYPNHFVDISNYQNEKLLALNAYGKELRDWPHSRSIKALAHLQSWRGATVGVEAAEAFYIGRHILR